MDKLWGQEKRSGQPGCRSLLVLPATLGKVWNISESQFLLFYFIKFLEITLVSKTVSLPSVQVYNSPVCCTGCSPPQVPSPAVPVHVTPFPLSPSPTPLLRQPPGCSPCLLRLLPSVYIPHVSNFHAKQSKSRGKGQEPSGSEYC